MAWIACPSCQKSISEDSVTCAYCGAVLPVKSPERAAAGKRTSAIGCGTAAIITLLLMVVGWLAATMPRNTTTQPPVVASNATPVEMPRAAETVATLVEAYEANALRADSLYKGAVVDVTGVVTDIGTEILGSPYVVLGADRNSVFGVQAVFARDQKSALLNLSKGQRVTIRCTLSGKLLNIVGRDCSFP